MLALPLQPSLFTLNVRSDIFGWRTLRTKPLVWLSGEVKSPPFSTAARLEAGFLLRRLQRGEELGPPHSRPMRSIGKRCHELRVPDEDVTWRIVYRIDADAIVLAEIFAKRPPGLRSVSSRTAGDG